MPLFLHPVTAVAQLRGPTDCHTDTLCRMFFHCSLGLLWASTAMRRKWQNLERTRSTPVGLLQQVGEEVGNPTTSTLCCLSPDPLPYEVLGEASFGQGCIF